MRPRTELALALGALTLVGLVVASVGRRGSVAGSGDPRRSTYLAGPAGARGYAESLERLGVRVSRFRRRAPELARHPAAGVMYAIIDPASALSPLDAVHVRSFATRGAGLILAGSGAEAAMRCYGYATAFRGIASVRLASDTVRVGPVLVAAAAEPRRGGGLLDDGSAVECRRVAARAVDTLLQTETGGLVAVVVTPDSGGPVVIVSDGSLFTNRAIRTTRAGEFTLGLAAGARQVMFDEYHQGFGPGGGMLAALRAWSARSPLGWALWQLAAVGTLAVLAAAIRFGPARPAIDRRRRSPLEHVRALATALAAARGGEVAAGLLIRGLRRRLARGGELRDADPRAWLDSLASQVRTARGRAGVAALRSVAAGHTGTGGVLRVAHAVEDVWDDLR